VPRISPVNTVQAMRIANFMMILQQGFPYPICPNS
jgi:hypothetical protein